MESDEFGPSLSFGETLEAGTKKPEQIPNASSDLAEKMPENVIHHPTSPGYSDQIGSTQFESTESTHGEPNGADPFEPFIRVLWLIETGETKEARLELDGLLQNESADVRRMAYDFKERLAKSEAARA